MANLLKNGQYRRQAFYRTFFASTTTNEVNPAFLVKKHEIWWKHALTHTDCSIVYTGLEFIMGGRGGHFGDLFLMT